MDKIEKIVFVSTRAMQYVVGSLGIVAFLKQRYTLAAVGFMMVLVIWNRQIIDRNEKKIIRNTELCAINRNALYREMNKGCI